MTKIVLRDIDGTIALRGDRAPHDHDMSIEDGVNWPVVKVCDALQAVGLEVLLMSGRDEKYRGVTEYWLNWHNIFPYRMHLIMRPAKDDRADEIVKREMYEKYIRGQYDVVAVLDDRAKVVAMWRELGLTCLQVAEGNF
ncbi:MAG: polynucleotide kinase [Nitrospira defluvii]|nr:polynucleotide kinase [Nitrospira defluvii]